VDEDLGSAQVIDMGLTLSFLSCTDKREKKISLIYGEIQMGCKVIYEEGLPNI
jgi:hypothetical protein